VVDVLAISQHLLTHKSQLIEDSQLKPPAQAAAASKTSTDKIGFSEQISHNKSIMSAKSILEADGKAILNYHLTRAPVIKPSPLPPPTKHNPPPRLATLNFPEDADVEGVLDQAEVTYPWLLQPGARFVAKPDML
jgi:hypothetical protein